MSVTSRRLAEEDRAPLEQSLAADAFHQGTTADFFYAPGTVANVYDDEQGPVMVVRGAAALRLDIQFLSNQDNERNAAAMLADFDRFAEQARAHGFQEIVFCTNSPGLATFCKRRFKFREVAGELRKLL